MFWAYFDHSIWVIFNSGTPGALLKLAHFLLIEIWGLPTLGSIILGISPSILKIFVSILLQFPELSQP